MSEKLKSQFPTLELISKIKSLKTRKLVLKEFSKNDDFCSAIREIVTNATKKNIPFTMSEKRKLKKYKSCILGLTKKRKDKKKTRDLICQTGTGVFLPIVVPLVASLLSNLLSNKQA